MAIVDISSWQGTIDWAKASKQIELAILRASVGSNKDQKYVEYAEGCRKYGVPYGCYHYLKAGIKAEAEKEAQLFYDAAAPQSPLFYCLDIEFEAQTQENTEAVALAFYEKMRALGAKKIGLYANQKRKFMSEGLVNKFDFTWVPRYGKNQGEADDKNYPPKFPCDLWQYASVGQIDGINARVDLNKLYGDKSLEWFTEGGKIMAEKFSNTHFVEFLKKFKGQRYWYATCVYKCTKDLYNRKKAQCPAHYGSSRTAQYERDIANGMLCADCIGLLKGYMWTSGGEGVFDGTFTNKYQSNGCPDRSANGFFSYAKSQGMDWGTIDTIPEIPGIAVRYDGHVGYYIGNGRVIEERGFNYGCVETALAGRGWLHWYKIPGIKYETSGPVEPVQPTIYKLGDRTLRRGMKGDDVKELQESLMKIGYELSKFGADSDYGAETETAVKKFQTASGLTADGIYGQNSHKALMEALADDEPDPEPVVPVAKVEHLVVKCDGSARIRKGDGTNYGIITTAKKGTKLTPVFGKDEKPLISANGWNAVKLNDTIGWISGDLVEEK